MSTIAATITVGKALIAAERWIRKGAIQDQFEESARQIDAEIGQVTYAVCKAIVARSFGKEPADEDVDAFMAGAANDASFPARAYRLLGEARKTSSQSRRRLLASVLFECTTLPEDDRDRVDMLVERLTMSDVALLKAIRAFESTMLDTMIWWRSAIYSIRIGGEFRIVPGHLVPGDGIDSDVLSIPGLPNDQVALVQLQSAGLVELDSGNRRGPVPVSDHATVLGVETTPLAHLFLGALRDVLSVDAARK